MRNNIFSISFRLLQCCAVDEASQRNGSAHTDGQATSSAEPLAGAASVSVNFLLRNFTEMNKLWTRMQRNLPPSDARDSIRQVRHHA
jgi:hypothetical protein